MHVKTYTGKTAAEALVQVKADLGDEAVILSNKTVTRNGVKLCEIMAAVETAPENDSPFAEVLARMAKGDGGLNGESRRDSVASRQAPAAARPAAGRASRQASGPAARAAQSLSRDDFLTDSLDAAGRFSREWRQIKQHFLALMKSQLDFEVLAPRQRVAMEYLEREGVTATGLAQVYRRLAADPEQTVLPVLEELAVCTPFNARNYPQKYQLLAGPSGVGKTNCVLRLALAAKQENAKTRICVVAGSDGSGRSRGTLRHYAELSGLAFREAATGEEWAALFAESRSFDLILVDLPALPRGETMAQWLAARGLDGPDAAMHLVLAPHYSPAQLEAFLDRHQASRLVSLIWTKLDEACSFGALVNTAHASGLPASALSFGPGLTDSLVPAEPEALWRLLFKHQLPGA